jgi:hypothetical protein
MFNTEVLLFKFVHFQHYFLCFFQVPGIIFYKNFCLWLQQIHAYTSKIPFSFITNDVQGRVKKAWKLLSFKYRNNICLPYLHKQWSFCFLFFFEYFPNFFRYLNVQGVFRLAWRFIFLVYEYTKRILRVHCETQYQDYRNFRNNSLLNGFTSYFFLDEEWLFLLEIQFF